MELSLSREQRREAKLFSRLAYSNPFLPERLDLESEILGPEFRQEATAWHVGMEQVSHQDNIQRLREKAWHWLNRSRGLVSLKSSAEDRGLYTSVVLYALYEEVSDDFLKLIHAPVAQFQSETRQLYERFMEVWKTWFTDGWMELPHQRPEHLFACFYQLRRAFLNTFTYISGSSRPVIELRASIWDSIFSRDMPLYQKSLYKIMAKISCLITGPSGSGKELVARAVGKSRYIPFDAKSRSFVGHPESSHISINLMSMAPNLLESELFGHVKGAFTGAISDHKGWVGQCPSWGALFLDEIGEVDLHLQVKLLRLLQNQEYQSVGDHNIKSFEAKVITATNRDLGHEVAEGNFREDLYYRLCSDQIKTPSLAEILSENEQELINIIGFSLHQWFDEKDEIERLQDQIYKDIRKQLGLNYPWPGNYRELEQCTRSLLLRRQYQPLRRQTTSGSSSDFARACEQGSLSMDEIHRHVSQLAMEAHAQDLSQTAAALQLDRRTLKKYLEL